jgi:FkbM family methyltransferase
MVVNLIKSKVLSLIQYLGYGVYNIEFVKTLEEGQQRQKTKWLENLNIKTVLDIGANEGQFAKYIHEIIPQAKIYSFEPLQDCFKKLVVNLKELPNFKAFNFALGDIVGESIIYRNHYSMSSSILPMLESHEQAFPFSKGEMEEEKIKIMRLDDIEHELEIENPLLIKIDVQGFEDKVINGGSQSIKKAEVLIVEMSTLPLYDSQLLFHDLYLMLRNLGFQYQGNLVQLNSALDGRIVQIDAIFVKSQSQ